MIEIISATRCDEAAFEKTPLALSLKQLVNGSQLVKHITFNNTDGLSAVYNRRIEQDSPDDILLFVHDDVWLDDYLTADRVTAGLKSYDVIGVAGNTRLAPAHVGWAFVEKDGQRAWDRPTLSGAVAHGKGPRGWIDVYGRSPRACELLDGLFVAARRSVLREKGVRFDERFTFHFYDIDFCRTARMKGLALGTWPIALTHLSGGSFGSPQWTEGLRLYREKWPE